MIPGKDPKSVAMKRNGTSNLLIFFEPLRGWRRIDITASRTAEVWAIQIKKMVDEDYPEVKKFV